MLVTHVSDGWVGLPTCLLCTEYCPPLVLKHPSRCGRLSFLAPLKAFKPLKATLPFTASIACMGIAPEDIGTANDPGVSQSPRKSNQPILDLIHHPTMD